MLNVNINRLKNKLVISGLLIMLTLVVSLLCWLSPANTPNHQTTKINSAPINIQNEPIAKSTIPDSEMNRVQNLIQGFEIAQNGHLKITENTRHILDVFLGDTSKTESNSLITIAKDQIYKNMKEPAAMEAVTLLEHYSAYKKAFTDIDQSTPQMNQQGNDNLLAGVKMQRIAALRNEYLSPEIVQAFYANDDSNTQYELARQRIMSINGLSDEQRQEELTALKNQFQKTSTTTGQ